MDKEKFVKMLTDRILDYEARPLSTAFMFLKNKDELEQKHDGTQDKYHHAKANAQAGQIYDVPTALVISYGRELWDILRKNTWDKAKGVTFKDVWNDSKKDIEADNYGLMQGMFHPFSDSNEILDKEWLRKLSH